MTHMSRPLAPSYVVPGWSTNTNYAAGADPWAGTATKVAPPSTAIGFTPKTGAAAQWFNYELNQAFVTDGSAKTYLTTLKDAVWDDFGAAHTMSFQGTLGLLHVRPLVHDRASNVWYKSSTISATEKPSVSYNGGVTWLDLAWPTGPGPASNSPVMGSNPAGLTVALDSGSDQGYYISSVGGSPRTFTRVTAGSVPGTATWNKITWLASGTGGGLFVAVGIGSSPAGSKMVTGAGNVNWSLGTGAIPGALAGVPTASRWLQAASPTLFVAIPMTTAGVNYMTSADAFTFTLRTSLPVLAGEQPRSLMYDAVSGQFVCCLAFLSSGQLRWIASSDGLTWAQVGTLGEPNMVAYGIAAAQGVWMQMIARAVGTAAERVTAIYSADKGTTWRICDVWFDLAGGGGTPEFVDVATDGHHFIASASEGLFVGTQSIGLRPALT